MTREELELRRLTGKSIRCCRFALAYNRGNFGKAHDMLSDNDSEGDKRR